MRRLAFLALVATLPASADDAQPDATPPVYEGDFADWDVAALKAGDWVEHELADADAPPASKRPAKRMACVKVEEGRVWIEVTQRNAGALLDGKVLLLAVTISDGKIAKAYFGKPGDAGRELKVAPGAAGGATPFGPPPKIAGKGKATKEKRRAAGVSFDCERIDTDVTTTIACCDLRVQTTTWISEKVPFAPRLPDDPGIAWDPKPSIKGGIVNRQVERSGRKSMMVLLKSGNDAKATLLVK